MLYCHTLSVWPFNTCFVDIFLYIAKCLSCLLISYIAVRNLHSMHTFVFVEFFWRVAFGKLQTCSLKTTYLQMCTVVKVIAFCWSVCVDCLALSISSDFWLCWLGHEAWHGIRGLGSRVRVLVFAVYPKTVVAPLYVHVQGLLSYLWDFSIHVLTCLSHHTWGVGGWGAHLTM
jgi:hypothetical protein